MANNNLPQGYKQTELGIIPEDWEVKPFSQIFDMYPNNTYPRDCMNDSRGVVRNIHYGDVLIKYPTIVDVGKCAIPYLSEDVKIKLQKLVQSGDIIIADTAEDETVGKCVEIKNVGNNKIVAGLHTFFCRPTTPFAAGWLGYYINSTNYHNQLIPYITGIKVSSISRTAIQETKLLLPPLPEQKAIAEVLSDVDGLIAALDKKIAKKRLLKQGAMQQLLTGKKRLLGFTDKWVEIKLGEISHITTGKKDVNEGCENGRYPFFTCSTTISRSDSFSFEKEAILIAGNGDVGNLHYYNGKFEAYQRTYVLSDFKIDTFYILHYLHAFLISTLNEGKVGSTIPYIVLGQLTNFNILVPPSQAEQQAIATILSDMDNEIANLEAQRDKYRLLKSGMMQKLLTGQIRLKTE